MKKSSKQLSLKTLRVHSEVLGFMSIESSLLPTPNNGTLIYESFESFFWIVDSDILHVISKKDSQTTPVELMKEEMSDLLQIVGDRDIYLIADITHATIQSKAQRDEWAKLEEEKFKAVAILSRNILMRMVAKLFFSLTKTHTTYGVFDNYYVALRWLNQQKVNDYESGEKNS